MRTILVALDGSTWAEGVLPALWRSMGAERDVALVLLRVVPVAQDGVVAYGGPGGTQAAGWDEGRHRLAAEAHAYLTSVRRRLGGRVRSVRTDVRLGAPARAIILAAREHAADVIAMATHARPGVWQALLGSTTAMVTRGAGAPVLAVRLPPAGVGASPNSKGRARVTPLASRLRPVTPPRSLDGRP